MIMTRLELILLLRTLNSLCKHKLYDEIDDLVKQALKDAKADEERNPTKD